MANTITALKQQKRNPQRVSVYLDGEYAFGLARIVAAWLEVGQRLDQERINELQAEDEVEAAYQRALNFLSYRPRSEAEIQRNLHKHEVGDTVIEMVLARLREKRFVDDAQFAADWVANRSDLKPRGAYALRAELRQKGIAEPLIERVLEDLDEDRLARAAAEKKTRQLKRFDWPEFRKKLSGYLARRGFGYEIVAEVCRAAWTDLHGHAPDTNF
jgi:regulatory protein